uniref:Uncharacterized protein n=1 Tax=Anguilla anguilla TaxID=7936 RepID=A0A0E9WSK5_ANGAN
MLQAARQLLVLHEIKLHQSIRNNIFSTFSDSYIINFVSLFSLHHKQRISFLRPWAGLQGLVESSVQIISLFSSTSTTSRCIN